MMASILSVSLALSRLPQRKSTAIHHDIVSAVVGRVKQGRKGLLGGGEGRGVPPDAMRVRYPPPPPLCASTPLPVERSRQFSAALFRCNVTLERLYFFAVLC